MTEEGMLSIVWRGTTYQVRYASSNLYDMDRPAYPCSDEGTLVALLQHCGVDAWATQQAVVVLWGGGVAVLPVVCSEAQIQAYFSPQPAPRGCRGAGDEGGPVKNPVLDEDTGGSCPSPSAAPFVSPERLTSVLVPA